MILTVVAQVTGPLGLTPEQLAAGGVTTVLIAVLTMFLRGDFITRKHHEQVIKEKDSSLARLEQAHATEVERLATERDLWREIGADSLNISEALVGRVKRG